MSVSHEEVCCRTFYRLLRAPTAFLQICSVQYFVFDDQLSHILKPVEKPGKFHPFCLNFINYEGYLTH